MPNLLSQIDALLPQTQCGLCHYSGCRPYAEALAKGKAEINLCPPGGVKTLDALAALLHQNAAPYRAAMREQEKPAERAFIREEECIGCTKCISVCPTDAIVGAAKQMHAILNTDCTGCGLCLPPCPVDCIDLVEAPILSQEQEKLQRDHFRILHQQHNHRMGKGSRKKTEIPHEPQLNLSIEARKSAIQEALARTKSEKHE